MSKIVNLVDSMMGLILALAILLVPLGLINQVSSKYLALLFGVSLLKVVYVYFYVKVVRVVLDIDVVEVLVKIGVDVESNPLTAEMLEDLKSILYGLPFSKELSIRFKYETQMKFIQTKEVIKESEITFIEESLKVQ